MYMKIAFDPVLSGVYGDRKITHFIFYLYNWRTLPTGIPYTIIFWHYYTYFGQIHNTLIY